MADALLDTTVFIDYWRGDTAAQQLINDVLGGRIAAAVSPITNIELWQYHALGRQEEIEYRALLLVTEEAPLGTTIGIDVGVALRSYSRSQRRRLMGDAIIAITAKRRGETIYSRNRRHLLRFHNQVVSY